MKRTRLYVTTLSLLLAVLLLAGCAGGAGSAPAQSAVPEAAPASEAAPQPEAAGAISVTDMTGREIALDAPATKIVALTPSDCEILYALGAGDTLVGRGEYCDYPEAVVDITSVQSGAETNVEQIISLEPQVVLMNTMAQTEEQVQALEAAGAKVVISDAVDLEGVYTSIRLIGAIVGKDGEAEAIIEEMKTTFADIEARVDKDGSETIYFEVSPLEYGLWAAGSGTFMDELAAMVGLTNAFEDVENWGEVSEEQVIQRDPDYIVTITMYFGEGPTPVEEILARPGWQDMKALQSGRVFNADSNEISRPGPRLAQAAETLYDFVYAGAAGAAPAESAA